MAFAKSIPRYLIVLLLVALVMAAIHWDINYTVRRATARWEREQLDNWKAKLIPLYDEMGLQHTKHPDSLSELLDPLLRAFEPLENGSSQ